MSAGASAKDLFSEALEKPASERADFLRAACGGDEALRARVDRLLAAHDRGSGFLGSPTGGSEAAHGPAEGPGAVIGRYRLLQAIGEGGFGTVFLAEQREPVTRRVALKIIKLGMDTRQVIARFEAERQALAMMDHPAIARVLDAGATDSGRPYFVMELVRGEPITVFCEAASLDLRARLELFQQVCHAVQHAHQKGIIHRDLKPSNILVAELDGRPAPRIIDFGIAKATGESGGLLTDKTLFTDFRQFLGTPEYMSPEQAGAGLDIDTRSDIYALGVLLYELLTGAPPFDAKRLRSAAWDEMRRIIREEEPQRPSTRLHSREGAPGARRPATAARPSTLVRGDLDWIVMKCLEKDRARRYETASGLAMDIQRHLEGEAVVAAPPSRAYRARKFVRRHRFGVAAAAAIGAVLTLGVVGTTAGLVRAHAAASESRRRTERALAVSGFLSSLADTGGAHARVMNSARLLDDAVARGASVYFDGGEREADVRLAVGVNYFRLGRPRDGEEHLRRALDIRTDRLGPDHPETLACAVELARQLVPWGRFSEPEAIARQAAESLEADLGLRDPATLDAYEALASVLRYLDQDDELAVLGQRIIPVQREVLGPLHLTTRRTIESFLDATIWSASQEARHPEAALLAERCVGEVLAAYDGGTLPFDRLEPLFRSAPRRILRNAGRLGDAEELTQGWLEHIARHGGDSYVGTPHLLTERARSLRELGRYEEAEAALRRAIELADRYQGALFHEATTARTALAWLLHVAKRHEEEESLIRECLETFSEVYGPEHDHTLDMMNRLAANLHAQGRLAEAESAALQAVEGYRRLVPLKPAALDAVLETYAAIRLDRGFPEEALAYYEKHPWGAVGTPNENDAIGIARHAACLRLVGRPADAERILRQAIGRAAAGGQPSPSVIRTLGEPLAALCDDLGRPDEAAAWRARLDAPGSTPPGLPGPRPPSRR